MQHTDCSFACNPEMGCLCHPSAWPLFLVFAAMCLVSAMAWWWMFPRWRKGVTLATIALVLAALVALRQPDDMDIARAGIISMSGWIGTIVCQEV